MPNRLHYGDNLEVLRTYVRDASVELIYLDPPFNSNANYNVIFAPPKALRTRQDAQHAQIEAFEDTWHWNDKAEDAFDQVARSGNTKAFDLLNAMRSFLGENDMMAYLAMMAVRLIELHRVLKQTGSLYLHCDPTASHYLKLLMDGVFGSDRFRNEIVWKRTPFAGSSKARSKQLPRSHDVIFFYSKSFEWIWHGPTTPYTDEYLSRFKWDDGDGRGLYRKTLLKTYSQATYNRLLADNRLVEPANAAARPSYKQYLSESSGCRQIDDNWMDINALNPVAQERLGYPTQKPLALLERIIAASSNAGDIVLDPFCGCGTAVHAAQKLGRQWIGIDVTHLAISLIEKRMQAAFPGIAFSVEGTPKDLASAEDLARRDKYQFQWWATSMVDAMPYGGKKKGADGGVDGIIYFKPDGRRTERAIVSVKGGDNVGVQMIRDLHSTMEREKAPIGVFISKVPPSVPMEREAAAVGRYHADATGKSYPRLQIITLGDLFQGKRPDIPYVDPSAAFRRAAREDTRAQPMLL